MYNKKNYNQSRERYEKNDLRQHHAQKYSKSMIILKSTIFALAIVFVVLLIAFEIAKNRKETNNLAGKCDKNHKINISQGVDAIREENGVLVLLTKAREGKQEVIRLDSSCGNELNRINLVID